MSTRGAVRDLPGEARAAGVAASFRIWVERHVHALLFSIGEMWRGRAATGLTVAVIGVALAVPATMQVAVQNVARLGGSVAEALQVSLFLQPSIDDAQAAEVAERLRQRPGIAAVQVIGRGEALAEYVQLTGLGDIDTLFGEDNPLPAVLVVSPRAGLGSHERLAALGEELGALPEVEAVQSDLQWSQRLVAWMEVGQRLLLLVTLLLGCGVVLVIGNTVRVSALGRREEIAVARLCGATDSFIRRPFLYAGLLFGLVGSALACVIVFAAVGWLSGPVQELSRLYLGDFSLRAPGLDEVAVLLLLGAVLGTVGAWFAVRRLLSRLEP